MKKSENGNGNKKVTGSASPRMWAVKQLTLERAAEKATCSMELLVLVTERRGRKWSENTLKL